MNHHRPWSWFAVAALLPMLLVGPLTARAADAELAAVFAVDRQGQLHRLDPCTLEDMALGFDHRYRVVDPYDEHLRWFASADGATLVRTHSQIPLAQAKGVNQPLPTIVATVIDLPAGEVRARFRIQGTHGVAGGQLSADGHRLVLAELAGRETTGTDAPPRAPRSIWRVIDTTTGQQITMVRSGRAYPGWDADWLIDPAGHLLYRLTQGKPAIGVLAYDLASGRKIGRQALPGAWGGDTASRLLRLNGVVVAGQVSPALVISPDGRQLAVVHADGLAVTRLDAHSLVVESRIQLEPGVASSAPVASSDTALPRGGIVTEPEFEWRPVFAADGRHLFLTGSGTVGREGDPDMSVPLQRVNLDTGMVEARADPFSLVSVMVSPDGTSLYVYRANLIQLPNGAVVVQESRIERLDAVTLVPLAPPRTGLYPPIVLVPERPVA